MSLKNNHQKSNGGGRHGQFSGPLHARDIVMAFRSLHHIANAGSCSFVSSVLALGWKYLALTSQSLHFIRRLMMAIQLP